ncbi:hypothetical protein EGT07_07855 [Herbaspirillum sp. HC18]|nr:hypothetical protein EGT07_07855 [Herbaspirillum sp. HC18]
MRRKRPLFSLGQVVATPGVLTHLEKHGVNAQEYLERHVRGDWGEVPSEDAVENNVAVRYGFRVISSYTIASEKVWVVTEADRSVTTMLFPSEY